MVHGLDDPGSTTGDQQVGVVRVTSHNNGVVDRRSDAGTDVVIGTPVGLDMA
jgi:hypothetical protein